MPRKKKSELEENQDKEIRNNNGDKLSKEIIDKENSKDNERINESEIKKKRTSDRSVLLRELKEKAKKLAEKIEVVNTKEIKEELEEKKDLLVPLEDYVKTGIHLGTRVITPDMRKYVYRRRADSIGVLNTTLIDEQIKKAIDYISKYPPEEIILVCKREAGWRPATLFSQVTGIKAFTKKYPAGMMTNLVLEKFYEPELVIICDSWVDKNAMNEAVKMNKRIVALCDTNNFTKNADLVIPCNNKGTKSLGLVFYLLARGYIKKRKINANLPSMEEFIKE
ncbi:MAG: 30S ribosomal protein S2 [Candidatus Pacearchaeota archaeon]